MMYKLLVSLLCAAVMHSVFCRLLKSDRATRAEIRHGFAFLGAAAGAVLWCLWLDAEDLHIAWLLLLACVVWVQVSTARHWRAGAPASFNKPKPPPERPAQPLDFALTQPPKRDQAWGAQIDLPRAGARNDVLRHIP